MEIRYLVVGILIFGGIITGMGLFAADLTSTYKVNNTDDLSYLDESQAMIGETANHTNIFKQTEITGIDILDVPFMIARSAYQILKLSFSSLDIANTLISQTADYLGLPTWFTNLIGGIIGALFLFVVLSVLLKYRI